MPEMPGPPQSNTTNVAVQIAQMVLQTLTLLFMAYLGTTSSKNHEKVDQISVRTDEAADRAEEVKKTLDATALSPEVKQAKEVQMWTNWKYLESVAQNSQSPEDIAKAMTAKKLYEDLKNKR